MKTTMRVCLLTICTLLAAACQKKSNNVWEENPTSSQSKQNNSSALWDNSGQSLVGPLDADFLPLNDEDLRNQFAEANLQQPTRELGEAGMPRADQFVAPKGDLALVFTPIFFNTDEHTTNKKEYIEIIRRAASHLQSHPNVYVIVEGYCDERGPEAYNLALGTRRANWVRSILMQNGVKPDQVHTVSLGKEYPFDLGHTPDAWAQNRRAHFRVHIQGE